MTVSQYLKEATTLLNTSSIDSSRLDALILTEYVLGLERSKLLAEPSLPISIKQLNLLNKYVSQRAKHIPISYIVHRAEFYGRAYYISSSVMQPRPESEAMIDQLKSLVKNSKDLNELSTIRIADVGTGSGVLGITAALEITNSKVDLIDIDKSALKVAKKNVVIHTINISVIHSDLLPDNNHLYNILLCNLPYVPDDFKINRAARYEPKLALFGGEDGLDLYRKLFRDIHKSKNKPLYILTESLFVSHKSLALIANKFGYQLLDGSGLIQVFRMSK